MSDIILEEVDNTDVQNKEMLKIFKTPMLFMLNFISSSKDRIFDEIRIKKHFRKQLLPHLPSENIEYQLSEYELTTD